MNRKSGAKKLMRSAGSYMDGSSLFTAMIIATSVLFVLAVVMFIVVGSINRTEVEKESTRLSIIESATFHEGIVIGGVDVSGMTYNEAKTALEAVETQLAEQIKFTLTYDDMEYSVDKNSFIITFNTVKLLDDAILLGRNGGLLALQSDLDNYSDGVEFDIEYELDPAPMYDMLDEIIEAVTVEPVNATLTPIDKSDVSYSTAVDGFPFKITDSVKGMTVDKESLYATLLDMSERRDFGTVQIPTMETEAEVTKDSIRETLVLKSTFYTSYSKGNGANRVFNMQKASDAICGTVLMPGDIFSSNGIIGPRYAELGWLDAPAVISGGAATENQPGGGVCQVSTTIYNAVVMANYQIVYRQNHSKQSSYVDGGLDATINTGTIDFKWKNNSDAPVYVFTWLNRSAEKIYCAIYGSKFPDTFDKIEFRSTFVKEITPTETEYATSSKLKPGQWVLRNKAITGYIYDSFAYFYKGTTLVNTVPVDTSVYKMHPKRYFVYPGYVPGTPLDPSLEVVIDEEGNFVPRYGYTEPTPTPGIDPTPTVPPVEPTPTPAPTIIPGSLSSVPRNPKETLA